MATTGMLSNNPAAVKLWALKGWVDVYKKAWFGKFFETGTITESDKLDGRGAGDQITITFNPILTGVGVGEGGVLVGTEEALNIKTDSMVINVYRHAVNNPASFSIEQQRTNVDFEKTSRQLLPGHLISRMDASAFNQLAGCTATSITVDTTVYSGSNLPFVTGMNTPTAPTTNRIVRANSAANDESLTSSDTMSLPLIDQAIKKIFNTYPNLEPLDGDMFDLYVNYSQYIDLKTDTTGKIQWYENELARVKGGELDGNAIFDVNGLGVKMIGRYANVNIYTSTRIAPGVNSSTSAPISTVARAVLTGKTALIYGSPFGRLKGYGDTKRINPPFEFVDQLSDYKYYKGIGYITIYGLKKIVFNGEDYGVVVLSTYAA